MGNSMSKTIVLMLFALLSLSGLVMVDSVFSQSTPKPSVPEFTVKFIDASYDVPTTYTIDPYTGQNITHLGYHVENRTIEVIIKNQPFTSYESNGQIVDFYLNVRIKGSYAENWTIIYNADFGYPTQSKSDYTKISYSLDEYEYPFWDNLNQGGTVDFQVEALIGSVHRDASTFWAPWVFDGEVSGWSNTQTVTVESQTPSPEPTSTPEPTPPNMGPTSPPSEEPLLTQEQALVLGLAITVAVLAVGLGLLLLRIKRK